MIDIIRDTIMDSLKLLPFLFVAFLIIEIIEHKLGDKSKNFISKSGKFGPLFGALFGAFPQCGFSVIATNLYITRIISLGTLISIYLSTSDEMLPILIGSNVQGSIILKIIGIKVLIGILFGFIIDFCLRKSKKENINYEICNDENCHCDEHGIFMSSVIHTLKTILFIFIISFILNILFKYVGDSYLSKIFLKDSIFAPFITSLIGLIPNCGSSVIITELYLSNAISIGSTIGGLLTGSGVALLILFKSNKNIKNNLLILGLIYFIGVLSGIVIDLTCIF